MSALFAYLCTPQKPLWIISNDLSASREKLTMKQPHMASSSCAVEADVKKKGYLLKVKVNDIMTFIFLINVSYH